MATSNSPGKALPGVAALAVVAGLSGVLLSLGDLASRDSIATNARNQQLAMLHDLVPPDRYDNDFLSDTILVSDPDLLGSADPVPVFRATRQGQPVAAVLMPTAPRGYTGPITLAVAVNADGTLAGVRATSHQETAGLGDAIDLANSPWILSFDGRSLDDPLLENWQLTQDGGSFDGFTGATVTPRAVVQAVRDALVYFGAHRSEIFADESQ